MRPRVPATSFVGRRKELATLAALLKSSRLLTLTGAGGVGKTRLAEALTTRLRLMVAWVDLADVRTESEIPATVERAIGGRGDGTLASATVALALGNARTVLVLDNCEHVIGAARAAAHRVLTADDQCRVIATSRTPLDVAGELVWRVPPLSLPEDAAGFGRGMRADAVKLFSDRAQAVDQSFVLDAINARLVGEICRRLDGHPLSIELVAARLRHLAFPDIVARLDHITGVSSAKDNADRHRTLDAALDWSYDLLGNHQRLVLRRTSVFVAGFTIAATEAVCGSDVPDVTGALSALIDSSLVELSPADGRYRMLEPVRQYAHRQLDQSDDVDQTLRRAALHLVQLAAEPMEPRTNRDSDRILRAEFGNLLSMMPWLERHDPAAALRVLARAASRFRTLVPVHISVVIEWIERLLLAHTIRDAVRANALLSLTQLELLAGRTDRPAHLLRRVSEAHAIGAEIGDTAVLERARYMRAADSFRRGPRDEALASYDEVLPTLSDAQLIGMAHTGRATVRQHLGDKAGAMADIGAAFAAWELHDAHLTTESTLTMFAAAEISFFAGDLEGAESHLRRSIATRRAAGEAQEPTPFEFLAHVSAVAGDAARALRLLGIADRLMEHHGSGPIPWWRLADRSWLPPAERECGRRARALRAEGRRFHPAAAVAFALGERVVSVGLTDRERAVAQLVADGLTDKEIATRLRISDRTAENHVQHIREKLGVRSRSQIARWFGETAATVDMVV